MKSLLGLLMIFLFLVEGSQALAARSRTKGYLIELSRDSKHGPEKLTVRFRKKQVLVNANSNFMNPEKPRIGYSFKQQEKADKKILKSIKKAMRYDEFEIEKEFKPKRAISIFVNSREVPYGSPAYTHIFSTLKQYVTQDQFKPYDTVEIKKGMTGRYAFIRKEDGRNKKPEIFKPTDRCFVEGKWSLCLIPDGNIWTKFKN